MKQVTPRRRKAPLRIVLAALISAALAALAPLTRSAAQTTQPALLAPIVSTARQPWPDVVSSLADALVEPGGEQAVSRLLPDDVLVRRFDHADYDDRLALRDALAGLTVVATHGYLGVPNSIASDLAVDFRNSTNVPDEVKAPMLPEDDTAAKRANVTAAQWFTNTLAPATAQPIGLIVLLKREDADGAVRTSETYSLVFVLLKADPTPTGQFRITHVVYGDTRNIVR
jgi:hypothetical protein